jgi:uncharacterized protein (TIGR03067 family)
MLLAGLFMVAVGLTVSAQNAPKAEAKKEDAKFDAEKLVGSWKVTGGKKAGTAVGEDAKKSVVTITKDSMTMTVGEGKFVFKYTVDAKASPVAIDIEITDGPVGKGEKTKGIIELKDGKLKLCYAAPGSTDRPAKFDDDKAFSFEMEKQKEEKK